jgi:cytochrome c-type biogenesis protein
VEVLAAASGVTETIDNGALLFALPIAVIAGLVSFFSPCVLPLGSFVWISRSLVRVCR